MMCQCIIELRYYENSTKEFRHGETLHRTAKPCMIGIWLKAVMSQVGIDIHIFTAHSTKGAATLKAKSAGVPRSLPPSVPTQLLWVPDVNLNIT